jgi:hypothetical protein
VERCGLASNGSGHGPVAGSCEHGHECVGFIEAMNFLTT